MFENRAQRLNHWAKLDAKMDELGFESVAMWQHRRDGVVYDFSAVDVDQLDEITANPEHIRLFVWQNVEGVLRDA